MVSLRLLASAALAAALSACAPTVMEAPAPSFAGPPPAFSASAFAWSQAPGREGVAGRLGPHPGAPRLTCQGSTVVLTPETPWTRARMAFLYGAFDRAALPADEVRARTPRAPAGDAGPFVRRTTCDAADRFSFTGLPAGAWYVITIARPAAGSGESIALMRRIVTRGGRVQAVEL